jgi:hypothetical protein
VLLSRHTLSCTVRHQVGFFVNTITHFDLAELLEVRLYTLLLSSTAFPKGLPELQVELYTMFCGKESVPLYCITSAQVNVTSLGKAFLMLFPKSSAGMTFIPNMVWSLLPSKQKTGFLILHKQFMEHHFRMLLRGIKDSEMRISSDTTSNDTESIHQ